MKRVVKLSRTATNQLDNILNYLEEEWSSDVKKKFVKRLDLALKHIDNYPDGFPKSEIIDSLRKCVVTKQITVFYKFTDSTIYVVSIFDNRQNPKKIKKK